LLIVPLSDGALAFQQDASVGELPMHAAGKLDSPQSQDLPFAELSYCAAREEAARSNKLCVVDAGASGCVPGAHMDREVWPAADVKTWITAHALAVKLDVESQKELAEELHINALPTIIVFRGDSELDRRQGALSISELLSWLDGLVVGG